MVTSPLKNFSEHLCMKNILSDGIRNFWWIFHHLQGQTSMKYYWHKAPAYLLNTTAKIIDFSTNLPKIFHFKFFKTRLLRCVKTDTNAFWNFHYFRKFTFCIIYTKKCESFFIKINLNPHKIPKSFSAHKKNYPRRSKKNLCFIQRSTFLSHKRNFYEDYKNQKLKISKQLNFLLPIINSKEFLSSFP